MSYVYFDFFAGGGMAGLGLGPQWRCRFANDLDPKKAASYRANHGGGAEMREGDVASIRAEELPGRPDMVWASFPCQDLSLAGRGAGLAGARSGAFRPFWRLMQALAAEDRAPRAILLENVCGTLTSHGGADFAELVSAMAALDYDVGALVVDAVHFVPQSRPRLFVLGARAGSPPEALIRRDVDPLWTPPALASAVARLPAAMRARWRWWRLPTPEPRTQTLEELVEDEPSDAPWRAPGATQDLLALMTPLHREKIRAAQSEGRRRVGAVYRRSRPDAAGVLRQRAEVRFDGIAGCLRTPAGGSSRQTLLVVDGPKLRSRLLSAREAARLMGLPDSYRLPARYNDAYKLIGDGVAVPVAAHLARTLIEPLLEAEAGRAAA